MDRECLVERIEEYLKALSQLEKALAQPQNRFVSCSLCPAW